MTYSRFFLCDLQVHTPADRDHRYGNVGGPTPNLHFARQLIAAHKAAGVEVIAVTDHNRVDWYPVLREAGDEAGVFVFPGAEVSVNGCHLLFIWDRADEGYRLAQQCLSTLWEPGETPFNHDGTPKPVGKGQVLEVARKAIEHKALVFAPHATAQGMGLFASKVCRNSPEVAQSGLIMGFDVHGDRRADVLSNPRRQFADILPRWFVSGDVRSLEDAGRRAIYLKLGHEPTLEGLRQAFVAAETRIRFPGVLQDEFAHIKHVAFIDDPCPRWPHISHLRIRGGFHDGLDVHFGPGLNAIIGGKGTGKSTLIEILRYVLEAVPPTGRTGDELRSNRLHNFRANAEAEIVFESGDGETYRVARSGGDLPAKLFRNDTEVSGLPVQKRAPVRIFGQRELQSYAQDPTLRREFVAAYGGDAWTRLVEEERNLLSRLLGAESLLSGLESELQQAESLRTELADLNERLDRARTRGVADLFQRSETLERANQQLAVAFQWPNRVIHAVEGLRQIYPAPAMPDNVSVPPGLLPILSQIEQESRTVVERLSTLIEGAQPALEQARAQWSRIVEEQRDTVQRALADAGFADLSELSDYQRRAVQIEDRLAALERLQEKANQHEAQRGNFLRLLADTRRRQSRLVEEAARALTEKVGQRVRVKIEPLSDTTQLLEVLSAVVKGQNVRRDQLERLVQHSPAKIASALRSGAVDVQKLGCTAGAAATLAGIPAPSIRAIEQTAMPDVIRIEINVGSSSQEHWIDVDQASPGQRATAMLALALSNGTEPLIIDQPEDDLDNRYIYEEVVKVLCRVCGQRQVIVVTHNANIPVLGDAEMILALDAVADRSSVLAAGGLENPFVAHQVRHILEGGDEAFRARQIRYEAGRGEA